MEAIEQIHQLRQWVEDKKPYHDGLTVAELAAKLATLNAKLATNLSTLHHDATQKQISVQKQVRDTGASLGDAELAGREAALEERESYENAKYVYDSTKNLISTLQSLSSRLSEEMKQGGLET